ncbi:MAG: cupin domain-containing protein [Patescibacteria group bacterium]|jgi:mannose-6-phosphate isomerase-like protein (cupin superfamily)
MIGYVANIEKETLVNENFRKVLFTAAHSQLVVMTLGPSEDIGAETHPDVDQFIRIEEGHGKVILDGEETEVEDNFAIVIPAGVEHNLVNTSSEDSLKLYTVYSPPEHRDGTIHATKEEAQADEQDHYLS